MTDLLFYGLRYSVALALLILAVLTIKRIAGKKLTAQAHYYIWFILPASGAITWLSPWLTDLAHLLETILHDSFGLPALSSKSSESSLLAQAAAPNGVRDFAVDTGPAWHPFSETIAALALAVWATGALLMLSRVLWGLLKAHSLSKASLPPCRPSFDQQFFQCRGLIRLRGSLADRISLRISSCVSSPITLGFLRPHILLPPTAAPNSELRYILLHELTHCKQHDMALNLLMRLFLAVNWFNPLLHYAVRRMEQDREICCDDFVLNLLDPRERSCYGQAVLNWAAQPSSVPTPFMAAVSMGGRKQELYQRIKNIAAYEPSSPSVRWFSVAILTWMVFCALILVPSADGLSVQSLRPQPSLDMREVDLRRCFGSHEGSFVLYDAQQDEYMVYQEAAARRRVSPNSTYKIYSGLAALETGSVTAKSSLRGWDGTSYPFPEWNQAQDLNTAMRHSVNWYFQSLDQSLGTQKLQDFYVLINYGNRDLTGGISKYWMESSLKISPLEQVMLLKDLHENKWGFQEQNIQAIKASLRIAEKSGAVLSGKTGTGMVEGRKTNGWFIGSVESGTDLYIFALNLQGKDGASGRKAMEITQEILADQGIW